MWKIIWKALAESMYYQNANIKNMYLDNIEYVNNLNYKCKCRYVWKKSNHSSFCVGFEVWGNESVLSQNGAEKKVKIF